MSLEKRYQVFISATYPDGQQARQALMLPMLEHGMVPTGLENAASQGDTLSFLEQRLIEQSDYVVLILAGRYGSLSPMGLSQIHREYVFATTKRKPVLAFIHDNPTLLPEADRETSREGQVRRDDFARLLESKVTCYRWNSLDALKEMAGRGLPQIMRQHPAIGWVRAGKAAGGDNDAEVSALKERIRALEKDRDEALGQVRPPLKTLARGNDQVNLDYSCNVYEDGACKQTLATTRLSWDQAFSCVAPLLMNPASEAVMQKALEDFIGQRALQDVQPQWPRAHAVRNVALASHAFNQVKIHLRALGLISKNAQRDSRGAPLWQLTPHGDNTMSQVMAVRRGGKNPVK